MAILAVLAVAVIIAAIVFTGGKNDEKKAEIRAVASFYPMYVMTENVLKYADATVENMTATLTGCIHDYQLTTRDMKTIEKANVFILNGKGMEHFAETVAKKNGKLTMITASAGIEGENPHVWMNPEYARTEIKNIADGLIEKFPDQKENIEKGYMEYDEKLAGVETEYKAARERLMKADMHAIVYNEAFEVFAEGLGIDLIAVFSLDENELPSAGEVSEAIAMAKTYDNVVVMVEGILASHADKILAEKDARTIDISPLTGGDGMDSYINDMIENLKKVEGK